MAKSSFVKKAQQLGTFTALWRYRYNLFGMLRDTLNGRYRPSFLTMVAFVASLIYVVSPVDVLPDFAPVIGWIDDGVVLYFLLRRILYEIDRYASSRRDLKPAK